MCSEISMVFFLLAMGSMFDHFTGNRVKSNILLGSDLSKSIDRLRDFTQGEDLLFLYKGCSFVNRKKD